MQATWVWFLGQEDPLEKVMATHSSILALEISWTEEPGWLQSMGLQKNQTWLKRLNNKSHIYTHMHIFDVLCSGILILCDSYKT